MKQYIWAVVLAIGLVAAMIANMTIYTVPEGSQAVVLRFGKFHGAVKTQPGINFKWFAPVERVIIKDTRVRVLKVIDRPMSTKDENIIIPRIAVGWKISDLKKFLESLRTDKEAAITITDRVEDARQRVTNTFTLSEIISADPGQPASYAKLENDLLTALRDGISQSDFGVEIVNLKITSLALPEQSTAKVSERMIAERNRRSQQTVTEGENEKQRIVNQALLERSKAISQAEADARRIRGEADAEAATHYKVFKENPKLARFLLRLETFKNVLSNKATLVLPADQPLDTLLKGSGSDVVGKDSNDE